MTPARILIVEDERIIAKGIEKRLKMFGYDVAGVASTGEEALEKLPWVRPDLVLMDIQLGTGIDGIETARRIRELLDLPVVFLTAHSDEATLERAKIATPSGYLLKPYEDRDLQTAIEMSLYRFKLNRQLRESQQWLGATLASIGDGVIATDDSGRVQLLNSAAEQLTGWTAEQARGKWIQDIFPVREEGTRLPVPNSALEALVCGQTARQGRNAVLTDRNGGEKHIDDSAAPIRCDNGAIAGAVLVFRDVTEQRGLERQLETAVQELAQKNTEKNLLLGMAAHDLRNPLSVIMGYSKYLLQSGRLDDQTASILDLIEKSAHRMLGMVEGLLDVSTVQAGQLTLRPERFDLGVLVGEVVTNSRPLAEAKSLDLRGEAVSARVVGDRLKLDQVLTNLVTNAIKYSPPGSPIKVVLEREGGEAVVRVIDCGPGIRPEEQSRLFQPFGRASVPSTAGEKSTGLGLAIARRIVEGHQGRIGLVSQVDIGSTFWFRLPLAGQDR